MTQISSALKSTKSLKSAPDKKDFILFFYFSPPF